MTTTTSVAGTRVSRPQRVAFSALSVLAGVYAAVNALQGLAVFGFAAGNIHRVQQLAFGVFWAAVAAALFAQARAPQRRPALYQQTVAATGALLVASAFGRALDAAPVVMLVAAVVLGVLHPARRTLLTLGPRPSVVGVAFVVAAAVPLVLYGLGQAELEHGSVPGSLHTGQWTHVAAAAFAIPLVGLVAALRAPGWRVSAWCAGLGAVLLGVGWLAHPELASAPGVGWGVAAATGGAAFIGVGEREVQRSTVRTGRPSGP